MGDANLLINWNSLTWLQSKDLKARIHCINVEISIAINRSNFEFNQLFRQMKKHWMGFSGIIDLSAKK